MLDPSQLLEQINFRRQIAAYDAELIARSRDAVARSKMLLQEDRPSTFVGRRHHAAPCEEKSRI